MVSCILITVILKVLLVNLLAALNFANVFKKMKNVRKIKKNVKNKIKNVKKRFFTSMASASRDIDLELTDWLQTRRTRSPRSTTN